MKNTTVRFLFAILLLAIAPVNGFSQSGGGTCHKKNQEGSWSAYSSCFVGTDGQHKARAYKFNDNCGDTVGDLQCVDFGTDPTYRTIPCVIQIDGSYAIDASGSVYNGGSYTHKEKSACP